ncbi:iron complex transport system substrate-binding protein [Desulfobaculum xiamenense]|uniref:Iron complex transport system substrate-binding protein n=1 Tax=Desulfobaculum xiamenense TaxID=995050 RepID=A0A846QH21_9BACT|nr:cobalamin-binding protein [Desulfobaculum xiamenense]NJB68116.1 iron complex transport system substrate-binding protein [Desulfobaculum xiamenense]
MRRHGLAALVLTLALCACAALAQAAELRRVTDQTGRVLDIPAHPVRVVALAPSVTEIAFAVGGGPQLVGRTQFSDHPAQAAPLPVVGTYVCLDVERIVTLWPDLCLAVRDGTPRDTVDALERFGIPVFAVENGTLDKVVDSVLAIGDALGRTKEARTVADNMRRRIDAVRETAAHATTRPGVLYQINAEPIIAPGYGTFLDEIIRLAGGRNLTAATGGYPRFTMEQAIALAPEVIIVPSMDRASTFARAAAAWREWPHVPAVRDGRIHHVNSDLFDRPSPRLVQGLEHMARLLHPELFPGDQ